MVAKQLRELKWACEDAGSPFARLPELHFMFNLGQAVINRIPEPKRDAYLPFNDVLFQPTGHRIDVIFRSLLKAKGPGGTIYYSRRQPTLMMACRRSLPSPNTPSKGRVSVSSRVGRPSYAALGDAFAYFDQCLYFERCDLYGGQLAFTFYDECKEGFASHGYVDGVLGEQNLDPRAGKPYYRVGYCPAVVEGDFVKAMTLLFPGYRNTPEHDAMLRSALPARTKQEMLAQIKDLDADTLYDSHNMSLIRWFHQHGVSQVVQLNHPVFAPAA